MFAKAVPAHDWTARGFLFLNQVAHALENESIYNPEEAIHHGSEGDIVRTSALYVLHPVNQALCADRQLAGTIRCLSEHTVNHIRSDITYYKSPIGPDHKPRAFAVIEFKKGGAINREEFTKAEKDLNRHQPNHYSEAAMREVDSTFFAGDSRILMKQASSYALTHRTRYVALFNWGVLVLVKFLNMNHHLPGEELLLEGVGEWCETTVIRCSQSSNDVRPALLGFLVEAYQNTPP
jgi:hypothetical protein